VHRLEIASARLSGYSRDAQHGGGDGRDRPSDRVGHSFRLGRLAMLRKIYLPALAAAIVNGSGSASASTIVGRAPRRR